MSAGLEVLQVILVDGNISTRLLVTTVRNGIVKSSSRLPDRNSFLVGTQIYVASAPDGDGLYEHSTLSASFDIADYIDPGSNLQIRALHALQYMNNVDIGDFYGAGCGVIVLELEGRCWHHIFVNTTAISFSSPRYHGRSYQPRKRTFVPCIDVLRSLSRTRFDATGPDMSSDVVFRS